MKENKYERTDENQMADRSYWEIFVAVCPNLVEALFAPITFNVDREKRLATLRIPGIAESDTEPIKNPATGEEHRARIALPNGFEYKEADRPCNSC